MSDFKTMAGGYNPYYEEPHTDEPQWCFVMRNGLCREIVRLTAELAEAKERLTAWEIAIDSWMVVNWVGIYSRERGVSETLGICLEKALDQERDELKTELAEAKERELVLREAITEAADSVAGIASTARSRLAASEHTMFQDVANELRAALGEEG